MTVATREIKTSASLRIVGEAKVVRWAGRRLAFRCCGVNSGRAEAEEDEMVVVKGGVCRKTFIVSMEWIY